MADTPLGTGTPPTRGRRRRLRPRRLIWMSVLGLVVCAVLVFMGFVVANRQPGEGVLPSVATTILGSRPTNVLLIGNNARNAKSPLTPGQADLIFVVHFDPVKHEVVLISIPRNVLVAYPNWRDPIPKVKSAFYMGGPQLAMQTVSKLIGMPVTKYVVTDFTSFAQAINAVGGLTVDVQAPIYDPIHSHAVFKAGVQHMNGAQVLAYIRVRQNQAGNGYRVNDFQRMSAAFGILTSLKHQVLAHLSPGEISNLLSLWTKDVATNLSQTQIAALAASSLHAQLVHVTVGEISDSMQLPTTPLPGINLEGGIEGAYYDVLTPQEIERVLGPYGATNPSTGLPPLPPRSSVHVVVGAGGQPLLARLQKAGIQATMGNVPASGGATLILYPQGELEAAMVVGRAVGQSNEQLQPANVPSIEVEPGS